MSAEIWVKNAIIPMQAAQPAGPYSHGIRWGDFLFLSGQVPRNPATGEILTSGVAEQARSMLENVGAILEGAGFTFADVVKTTVFLTDISTFATMNEVYGSFFSQPFPARSTVEVSRLPLGAQMEIDVIAARSAIELGSRRS